MAYDIEKVLVRLGLEAKRHGREWEGLCPNHVDRSPSWRVRDEPGSTKHGFHHCWPCGFGGSLIDLVMHVNKTGFHAARVWLEGSDTNVDAPAPTNVELRTLPRFGFRLPSGVSFGPLEQWVTPARRYALKRGITPGQVTRWGLGYAVDGRLGGRIVVPYRDRTGLPAGYTARSYDDSLRRYLEAEVWEKPNRAVAFGEQYWPHPADSWEDCSVFAAEGALNALAIERAMPGAYVAALAGSQPHPAIVSKLARFATIFIVTDPDSAGDKVAQSLMTTFSRHVRHVERIRLPEDQDAASIPTTALSIHLRGHS